MTTFAFCLIAFWAGFLFGVVDGSEELAILPAVVTVSFVAVLALKGLGWV